MPFHTMDLVIILVIASLLFGAKRLPEMGAAIGKTIKEFQKSMRDEPVEAPTPAPVPQVTAPTTPPASISAPNTTVTTSEPAAEQMR